MNLYDETGEFSDDFFRFLSASSRQFERSLSEFLQNCDAPAISYMNKAAIHSYVSNYFAGSTLMAVEDHNIRLRIQELKEGQSDIQTD